MKGKQTHRAEHNVVFVSEFSFFRSFSIFFSYYQRRIENSFKHLRWNVLQKQLTAFAKHFIIDVWQGPAYVSVIVRTYLKI